MDRLEQSLMRLGKAVERLDEAMALLPQEQEAPEETKRLQAEIVRLRAKSEEDAKLRAEAAGAVREALQDLRSAVARGRDEGEQANA